MLSEDIISRLNHQVTDEFQAFYSYLAMSYYCTSINLRGFAGWLKIQADEEYIHGAKIVAYLDDNGAKVELGALKAPKNSYGSVLEVFESALKSERDITDQLKAIAAAAQSEGDLTTVSFLHWFLTEQVEEVGIVTEVVEKLKLIGDDGTGLLALDRDMAGRAPEASEA